MPQDPNDEPGSVLLERIRAAREAEGGKRGRGRPPGANAQAGAGAQGAEQKRRGRPSKVREAISEPDARPAAVPEAVEASSFEDALQRLEEQKLARAGHPSGQPLRHRRMKTDLTG